MHFYFASVGTLYHQQISGSLEYYSIELMHAISEIWSCVWTLFPREVCQNIHMMGFIIRKGGYMDILVTDKATGC